MQANRPRVVLITGASSGIGQACAAWLQQCGCRVYGTGRQAPALAALPAAELDASASFTLLPMDVTAEASSAHTINCILAREGRLDVVINNARYSLAGVVEEHYSARSSSVVGHQFLWSAARVTHGTPRAAPARQWLCDQY
jgi:NADP-dependent 3-hydroxy acid dehydrogenase YdfG